MPSTRPPSLADHRRPLPAPTAVLEPGSSTAGRALIQTNMSDAGEAHKSSGARRKIEPVLAGTMLALCTPAARALLPPCSSSICDSRTWPTPPHFFFLVGPCVGAPTPAGAFGSHLAAPLALMAWVSFRIPHCKRLFGMLRKCPEHKDTHGTAHKDRTYTRVSWRARHKGAASSRAARSGSQGSGRGVS